MSRHPLAITADEAIEMLRYSAQHSAWLAALLRAIHMELTSDTQILEPRVMRAKELASLGQYLADDMHSYIGNSAGELQTALDTAETEEVHHG